MDLNHSAQIQPVVLLMSPATYRAGAFTAAARALGLPAITVVDMPEALREEWHAQNGVPFANHDVAVDEIARIAKDAGAVAVLSVDDSATEIAALVSKRIGFPHNDPESATAARDKLVMRRMMRAAGARTPQFEAYPAASDPGEIAAGMTFPCVLKPLRLSGSRGVIRVDDVQGFERAFRRVADVIADSDDVSAAHILVEEYLPGDEVALEGLLTDGELTVLALFDKPDPLVGPFFEETIYVTPSRHPEVTQRDIRETTQIAAQALGLREGPIHAELRVNERGAWLIEVAGRSIGGLCSTILSFGSGMSLEEIILRHATGMHIPTLERSSGAVGVMMIPIPRSGIFRGVSGEEAALQVAGITGLEISARPNYPIQTLPEGASYLGFIFAKGETPDEVERALREAHGRLAIRIDALAPFVRASVPSTATQP